MEPDVGQAYCNGSVFCKHPRTAIPSPKEHPHQTILSKIVTAGSGKTTSDYSSAKLSKTNSSLRAGQAEVQASSSQELQNSSVSYRVSQGHEASSAEQQLNDGQLVRFIYGDYDNRK